MELELRFDGLAEDVVEARADVQLLDLGIADAPPDTPAATAPSFSVSSDHPHRRVVVDVPGGEGAYEPGLVVRVRGRTAQNEAVEFFNTSATPVTAASEGPVRVVLSRIV